MRIVLFLAAFLSVCSLQAQKANSSDYYYEIPENPEKYTSETVAARMVDGLGFRYYWASESLRAEDLEYRPSPEASSTLQTLRHILGLSNVVLMAAKGEINKGAGNVAEMSYEELRAKTLANLEEASKLLKAQKKGTLKKRQMRFQRQDNTIDYPFWNLINGPLSDAIYHTGQLVSFRRTSGNPIYPKLSMLRGNVRD